MNNLNRVRKIGDWVFFRTLLTSLDLSSITNLTKIGTNFLRGSRALKILNLPDLSQVESIGEGFCRDLFSIENLDLSTLSSDVKLEGERPAYCPPFNSSNFINPVLNLSEYYILTSSANNQFISSNLDFLGLIFVRLTANNTLECTSRGVLIK